MNFAVDDRPTDFSQFVGNESVVNAIKQGLENKTLPNAILFTGASGTGKSSMTNLIINALNVNKEINLHFIDCGVTKDIDSFRKTIDSIKSPIFGGMKDNAVYVLEECHKLTINAQEAMLSTLENLPSNKYVIATTTCCDSLLKTFSSRFVQYQLNSLSYEKMYNELLIPIIRKYEIKIKKSTVDSIIKISEGNNRKALSILSSIAFLNPEEQIQQILITEEKKEEQVIDIINKILSETFTSFSCTKYFNDLRKTNLEPEQLRCCFLTYLQNLMQKVTTEELASKIVFLFENMSGKSFYGNNNWGNFYCILYNYYKKFQIF